MGSRPKARPSARQAPKPTKRPAKRAQSSSKRAPPARPKTGSGKGSTAKPSVAKLRSTIEKIPTVEPIRLPRLDRSHVLSLSFLRDGDEFTARLETDTGQITELKNRSLDQLLTLVASELEDILE
ncbi:MAG: hypothetical protein L3J93_04560 [Thermoplasmata archaeon]|nr:hypothetical protein [Thermoplasmata archaeon]